MSKGNACYAARVIHNLYFYNNLLVETRASLDNGTFGEFKRANVEKLNRRL